MSGRSEFFLRYVRTLLLELLDGPSQQAVFVFNPGDRGLIASLDALSAEVTSAWPGGGSSVAAHVDHLRYGFELLNRWARGEDPWTDADYAASWERQPSTTSSGGRCVQRWPTRPAHGWRLPMGRAIGTT